MPTASPEVVAVINTSPDTVELLSHALEPAGFVVVSAYTHEIRAGGFDIEAFLRVHQPKVVVYDLAPPYDRNWRLLQHLRTGALGAIRIVLTSTNARESQALAGRDEQIYEIIGKPYDLDKIVQAVREAARARPTR